MATITFSDARHKALNGRPWTFKLQFSGFSSQGGKSNKFWRATGRGMREPVEVTYGAVGSEGTTIVKDWAYVARKAPEKEAKGYVVVFTPYVRIRQQTIDAFNAQKGQRTPQPLPATHPVPVPVRARPTQDPYERIVEVEPDTKTGNWNGYDANGKLVMRITKQGARQLLQLNPAIVVRGL